MRHLRMITLATLLGTATVALFNHAGRDDTSAQPGSSTTTDSVASTPRADPRRDRAAESLKFATIAETHYSPPAPRIDVAEAPPTRLATGASIASATTSAQPDYADYLAEQVEIEAYDATPDDGVTTQLEEGVLAHLERKIAGRVELLDGHCGRTLCRLSLGFDDRDDARRGADAVIFAIPWDGEGYYHTQEHDDGELVVYVAREGQPLPTPVY